MHVVMSHGEELNDTLELDLNLLQAKFTLQWVTAAL